MWISMPTPVTKSSQMEESGSSRKPASALNEASRAVALHEVQMPVAAAQPGINNFLEGLSRAVREVRVLDDREAGEQERNHDRADADRVDRGLLQSPPEKEHHRGPEGREERNQVDVV